MNRSRTMISRSCRLFAVLLAAPALAFAAPLSPAHAQVQSPAEQLAAASALYDAGKFAQAAKILDAFLADNPSHPRAGAAALALGRCRSELGQYAKAVPAYEKAIAAKDPSVKNTAELGLGEAALQTSQWAKAAGALKAATAAGVTPAQASVAYDWLGQAEYQLGQYAAAAQAYSEVVGKYANSEAAADATFGAGLAALKLGRTDEAHGRLRAVMDRYPKSENRPQALLLLGQMDLDAKQYGQARDDFQTALAASGADADTKQAAEDGLVNALLKLGDNAGAATRLQSILARLPAGDPQRFPAELTLGRCLYAQKQYAPAQAAYSAAAKSPDAKVAAQGLYWSANCALALGHSAEAAALFASVASRFPASELAAKARAKAGDVKAAVKEGSAAGVLKQARLDLDAKKYAPASVALTALLATAPPADVSAEAHYLIGLADQGMGKNGPALTALTAAVANGTGADWLPDAHVQLAWLNIERKQPASAEKAARAALSLSGKPGYSPAVEQQARLALVQADLDQQKWDDALAGCQTLSAGSPSPDVMVTVLFTQAWVSEKQGRAAAALPLWSRLASEFGQSAFASQALLHLGDASFKAQKFDDAQARYSDLLAKYPQSADAPAARLGLGNTLYSLGKYDSAAAAFDALAADKSATDLRPEALYWAGASWEKAGKKTQAVQRLARLVSEYPASARVAKAKVRLAYLKAGG
jgi:TolA-binding protein